MQRRLRRRRSKPSGLYLRVRGCMGRLQRRLKADTHERDFAPGACSRGTLREQSSSLCTNDFMGILHPR